MGNGLKVKRKWGEADEASKDAGDGGREGERCTWPRGWSSGKGLKKQTSEEEVCWGEGGGPRLGVGRVAGRVQIWKERRGAKGLAGEGAMGRVERGEPMGWRTGRGRSWSGPRAFRTALAGEQRRAGAGRLEPEALGRPP